MIALLLLLLGSCSLLHDDFPNRTCNASSDCFEASGEVCDLDKGECVPGLDAAPAVDSQPALDSPPVADADPSDA